jgi:diguanylate cyclase (GGDEF)-like protein
MKKTTFRTKWGAGILMLLTAFIASQMVYRRSIIRLHDQLLSAAAIAEQMHASEKFHSALHLMLMAATRYAETGNESLRTDFVRELDVARSALPVLGTRHGSNASGKLETDFEAYSLILGGVVSSPPGGADRSGLAHAQKLFDSTFFHFYSDLHLRHRADIEQAAQSAHRIQFWTEGLFFAQLGLTVLFSVVGLLYLERIIQAFLSDAERMAITDGLTGVFNRRYLDSALEEELGRTGRHGRSMTIAMIDIDHFKRFNDTKGHQAGDQLLRALTQVMRQNTRAEDRIARYGGEEFVVILPETALGAGVTAAEKLRSAIEQHFSDGAGPGGQVTVSIGVATFPEDGTSAEQLIARADERLYHAKADGRNRVVPAMIDASSVADRGTIARHTTPGA